MRTFCGIIYIILRLGEYLLCGGGPKVVKATFLQNKKSCPFSVRFAVKSRRQDVLSV